MPSREAPIDLSAFRFAFPSSVSPLSAFRLPLCLPRFGFTAFRLPLCLPRFGFTAFRFPLSAFSCLFQMRRVLRQQMLKVLLHLDRLQLMELHLQFRQLRLAEHRLARRYADDWLTVDRSQRRPRPRRIVVSPNELYSGQPAPNLRRQAR